MEYTSARARRFRYPYAALALAAIVALVGMPVAAQAATITYYQAPRANNSLFMEASTNTITGGWAACSGSHGSLYAHGRTTNVQGLSIYASATAQNCGVASFTHSSYIGRSGCKWYVSAAADPLNLTCKRVSP